MTYLELLWLIGPDGNGLLVQIVLLDVRDSLIEVIRT